MGSREREAGRGLRADPLWLLDFAGLAGAGLFAWTVAGVGGLPALLAYPFVRELALAAAAIALIVRLLDLAARRRSARSAAQAEVARRLDLLDDALLDLRRSLSREPARRFMDCHGAFEGALNASHGRLNAAAARLAPECLAACGPIAEDLTRTVPHRAEIASRAYRLTQEIGRAGRRGELDPYAAGDLNALIEDALGVMDEALYAEWNADHFGRLGAVQRHFARRVERREGDVVRRIDAEAAGLFDLLNTHVREKVALLDRLAAWGRIRDDLRFALGGVRRKAPEPLLPQPVAARFAVAPRAGRSQAAQRPLHLPAAND